MILPDKSNESKYVILSTKSVPTLVGKNVSNLNIKLDATTTKTKKNKTT